MTRRLLGLGGSISPGSNDNDTNHPSNWTDDQYREFAKRWINELARMTKWRDGQEIPPFASDSKRVEKLAGIPESVLKDCVRYRTTESMDDWLNLTPSQRYKRAKQEWSNHECSVYKRYGLYYANKDKPGCSADNGCIEKCIYYPDTGSIDDEQVLSWYRDTIGDMTYDQLKHVNDGFVEEFAKLLKKQAKELPTNIPYQKDYYRTYYPSIMDL